MEGGIPALPDTRALRMDDGDELRRLFADLRAQQSEFTFTNLHMWRDAYQLRLSSVGDAVVIFSWRADPEDSFLFPPLGPGANAGVVRRCMEHMAREGHAARMSRATMEDLQRLVVSDDEFEMRPDRDQWDYVYGVRDLIELRGNRYHKKRNHLEQFAKSYPYTYRTLTRDLIPGCIELQDRWCDEKHCDLVSTLRSESRAVKESLEQFDTLGITGGCIEVEGEVEAFALGELLNPETVVIHIEKANAIYHGLYQAINQQFLEHEWSNVAYVNREQDMGVAGLRKAKQSYHPHHMVEKFEVRLR